MNKFISTIACVAALSTVSLYAAEPGTAGERFENAVQNAGQSLERAAGIAARQTKEAWTKTKASLSNDPQTYREGARQKLDELGQEIAALRKQQSVLSSHPYFATRLQALEQQRDFAAQEFQRLQDDDIRRGGVGMRKDVDNVLDRLQDYVSTAHEEANDIKTENS